MIYIISGNEEYLIEKKLYSIISECKNYEIVKFDGLDKKFSIDELIDAYCNVSFLSDNKLILVNNPYFLNKKINDEELNKIIEITNNQNFESTLVFYSKDGSINEKLKAFKELSTNAQVIKLNQLKKQDYYSECYSIVKEYKINLDNTLINLIINSSNNSLVLFKQNVEILSLYPEKITRDVINKLLVISNEETVFNLINSLTNKEVSLSIKYARKLMTNNSNINGLISLIANQLRFLYEVSYYRNKNLSISEIADLTETKNSYRIEKAFESLDHLIDSEILKLLDYISNIDYKLKINTDINDELQLELFITNLINYE